MVSGLSLVQSAQALRIRGSRSGVGAEQATSAGLSAHYGSTARFLVSSPADRTGDRRQERLAGNLWLDEPVQASLLQSRAARGAGRSFALRGFAAESRPVAALASA